jgi:hypothetical protein
MGYISSPLIVVSGRSQPEPSKPNVFYMEKPFEVDCFKDLVYVLLGESLLIRPDFGKLYQNYDQNTQKILQVLALLKDEFLIYLKRIQQVSGSTDQKEWEGIRHKLINQINTLNLKRLKELLPERVTDLNQGALEEIQSLFDYYQCCIRFEICQLSGRKSVKKSTD